MSQRHQRQRARLAARLYPTTGSRVALGSANAEVGGPRESAEGGARIRSTRSLVRPAVLGRSPLAMVLMRPSQRPPVRLDAPSQALGRPKATARAGATRASRAGRSDDAPALIRLHSSVDSGPYLKGHLAVPTRLARTLKRDVPGGTRTAVAASVSETPVVSDPATWNPEGSRNRVGTGTGVHCQTKVSPRRSSSMEILPHRVGA